MNKEQAKARACAAIDAHADRLIALGEDIFAHPELGFKETNTAAKIEAEMKKMGAPYRSGIALTGLRADLLAGAAGKNGPLMSVMGELDSVPCPRPSQRGPGDGRRPFVRAQRAVDDDAGRRLGAA